MQSLVIPKTQGHKEPLGGAEPGTRKIQMMQNLIPETLHDAGDTAVLHRECIEDARGTAALHK
eukprot:scaffold60951_cov20-Tisochrysis_lutea.AAC.1